MKKKKRRTRRRSRGGNRLIISRIRGVRSSRYSIGAAAISE